MIDEVRGVGHGTGVLSLCQPPLPLQSLKIRAGLFCSRFFPVKMKWLCVSKFLNLSSYAFLTFHLSFGPTFSFMLQYDD